MKVKVDIDFYCLCKYKKDRLLDITSYIYPNTGNSPPPKWTLTSKNNKKNNNAFLIQLRYKPQPLILQCGNLMIGCILGVLVVIMVMTCFVRWRDKI